MTKAIALACAAALAACGDAAYTLSGVTSDGAPVTGMARQNMTWGDGSFEARIGGGVVCRGRWGGSEAIVFVRVVPVVCDDGRSGDARVSYSNGAQIADVMLSDGTTALLAVERAQP